MRPAAGERRGAGEGSVPGDFADASSEPSGFDSAWGPLRQPLFRAFWCASLLSNLGTWVHDVAAAWLMTTLDPSPVMVSAIRTSMALPMLLLALPAGVLADRVDRRKLLIATQIGMFCVASTLAVLTWMQLIGPIGLLSLTVLMGMGTVVHAPTWQSIIPEVVERRSIPAAVGLGSISFNIARAAGPAIGGAIVAAVGAWAAFGTNGVSFLVVVVVLLCWRRPVPAGPPPERRLRSALAAGLRFVFQTEAMRHVLVRNVLFVVPASSIWALLPLVARNHLDLTARGFGVMVGLIGVGAVFAAAVLPRLRHRFGSDGVVVGAGIVAACCLALLAIGQSRAIDLPLMLPLGACWMMTLTTLNATAQMTLPGHLRARGMSTYLMFFAAGMGTGSFAWGWVAEASSLSGALLVAAAVMAVTAPLGRYFTLGVALTDASSAAKG